MARASLWGRTSGSRFSVTVTCPTRTSRTFPTRPFFTPDTRTGSPSFRPLTFLNTTSTGIAFETIERPVSQNMKPVNTTKPTSTRAPTVTSRLYVTSTRLPTFLRFGLDQRHLEIALQELQHRGILGREDLVRRSDGADLRLPQERHPVRHPKQPRTSCDTTTLVTPSSSRSRSTSPSITSAFTGSSPEVGSSYRRYLDCPAIARAIPTRFFIPPDSSAGSLAATSAARFTSRRHSCIRFSQNFSSL